MSADRYNLRDVYATTLCEIAEKHSDLVVLDADSKEPTGVDKFAKKFPNRAFSFGIAEQNMISAAAGMAIEGLVPFVNTYAIFACMRALDQIRNNVAYTNLNVKIAVSHFGLDVGTDGVTHQIVEDISIMRSIANMVVISPADDIEMSQVTRFAYEHKGPVYLKTGKSKVPRVHSPSYKFQLGKPSVLCDGKDVALFSIGVMVHRTLQAAEVLRKDGIQASVINLATLKPVDEAAVAQIFKQCGAAVAVEDHTSLGGLSGVLAEIAVRHCPIPIGMVGAPDKFLEAGKPDELYSKYGLSTESIVSAVKNVVKRKNDR